MSPFQRHFDLTPTRKSTSDSGEHWLDDCGNIEETSSLEKAEVQSSAVQHCRGSVPSRKTHKEGVAVAVAARLDIAR